MLGQRTAPLPDWRARARMAAGRLLLIQWLTAKNPLGPSSQRVEARRFWLAWGRFLLATALALACLATAWWTGLWGDWMWYWIAAFAMAMLVSGPSSLPSWRRDTRMHQGVNDLLAGITSADPDIVPDATRQPPAFAPNEFAAASSQPVAVYQPQAYSLRQANYGVGCSIVTGLVLLAQCLLGRFVASPFSGWQGAVAGAAVLAGGLVAATRLLAGRRPLQVLATDHGLMWRTPGVVPGIWHRPSFIPWHGLRAFSVFSVPQGTTSDGRDAAFTLFAAHGPPGTLTWTLWAKGYHQRGGRPARGQDDPAWRLARLIVTYTGHTLRDPTDAAVRLFQVPGTALTPRSRHLAISPWLAGCMALIVALAGVGLLITQPRSYAARLAQTEMHAPLYADALSAPTGDWPQGAQPGGTYQYHNGAYILTEGNGDTCCDIYAWPVRTFSGATVEVDVRQATDFDLSEAGLVLRADDASGTMLVFTLTTGGEWMVKRFHYAPHQPGTSDEQTLLYDGAVLPASAIHKGSGAVNELAAIVRGTSYALFINQQFAGVYHDGGLFAPGPLSGHFGVYYDGLGTSASFSNFRVYPALPPSPLVPV